ncbi:MAG: hypothetical protein LBB77_04295 [Treponema sp.]|nr:hypothetical protein [Treponema sp.]
MIQFARQGAFTYHVGKMVVSGFYRTTGERGLSSSSDGYPVANGVSVFFGGIEFCLNEDEGFKISADSGTPESLAPEYMVLSGETVRFRLSGGNELNFATRYTGGALELRISGVLGEGVRALELPYRPLRTSRIRDAGDGQITVIAGGIEYGFGRSVLNGDRRVLSIEAGEPAVSYRAIPGKKDFNPGDFIIPGAGNKEEYEAALSRWRDQSFSLWTRTIGNSNNEDTINAYIGDSLHRGGYKSALAAVSPAFLNGDRRTFESSVYLGRLDIGLRSISAFEREKLSRLSRLINEKSRDILREAHIIEYLGIRGYQNFIDDGVEIVKALDPASIPEDLTAGILEGWYDWGQYRPGQENPFDRLVDQSCFVISGGVKATPEGDGVLVFSADGEANTEFNFRLGKALEVYGEAAGDEGWAGLGRSLILSILSIVDSSGSLPETLILSEAGALREKPESARFNSSRLYRTIPADTYPRAVGLSGGMWAWTTASGISVSQGSNMVDISVPFPMGETHYMMIRGVRPVSRVQLYDIDFRTDPQFERYDSSGWSYSASEQTLLFKMKHRASVEHIRIFY